jgi:hypothetical protein
MPVFDSAQAARSRDHHPRPQVQQQQQEVLLPDRPEVTCVMLCLCSWSCMPKQKTCECLREHGACHMSAMLQSDLLVGAELHRDLHTGHLRELCLAKGHRPALRCACHTFVVLYCPARCCRRRRQPRRQLGGIERCCCWYQRRGRGR